MSTPEQTQAALEFLDVCRDALFTIATQFTCWEAEAVADLYRAFGQGDEADSFLAYHGSGDDDESDLHAELWTLYAAKNYPAEQR